MVRARILLGSICAALALSLAGATRKAFAEPTPSSSPDPQLVTSGMPQDTVTNDPSSSSSSSSALNAQPSFSVVRGGATLGVGGTL